MTTVRALRSFLAMFPLAAMAACAGGPEDSPATETVGVQDSELNLIATADRPGGNQLRFYEPMPGQILTVELGQGATMPEMGDAVALYRAAVPGAAVPAALANAQARAESLRLLDNPADYQADLAAMSLTPERAVDRAPGAGARDSNPCSINTFIANECNSGDQEWCKINWANGFWASNSSVNYMHNAVCSLTGTVTLKLIVNSSLKASYTVTKGGMGKVVWIQHPIYLPVPPFFISNRFGFYTEITNASGDVFNVGGAAGDE